jgi:branched-subunit amino acid aminotransferase/4-amino-4-deoxychorismate lyase
MQQLSVTKVWNSENLQDAMPSTAFARDQGLLRGWGVFETMLAVGSEVPLWSRHWARLQRGAQQLEIPLLPELVFRQALQQTLAVAATTLPQIRTAANCYRVRLTVTAGDGDLWMLPGETPMCVLSASSCAAPLPLSEQSGLSLLTYPQPFFALPILQGCKHTSYLPWLMAARYARHHGCDDAGLLDPTGNLIETSHRNLFVWRDEQLWTPPLSSGCLPGIMRGLLLECADRLGIRVCEQPLTLVDAMGAQNIFLTSAVSVCQAVKKWDEQSFPTSAWPQALQDLEQELRRVLDVVPFG